MSVDNHYMVDLKNLNKSSLLTTDQAKLVIEYMIPYVFDISPNAEEKGHTSYNKKWK